VLVHVARDEQLVAAHGEADDAAAFLGCDRQAGVAGLDGEHRRAVSPSAAVRADILS
jgi:hypothetical protein